MASAKKARVRKSRKAVPVVDVPQVDVKLSAANDKPEAAPVVKAELQTDAGKARSAGIQQFILAGRPTREQFRAVFGPRGHLMTWVEREEAGCDAAHFQKFLASGKTAIPEPKAKK
ncbi:MAG: hypothetical protein WA741_32180 [Candidatus Sulfotelmatobacter sp.]